MAKDSKKKTVILIVGLSVLLLASLVYVVVDVYSDYRYNRDLAFYNEGYGKGATDASEAVVYKLVQQASTCEAVPIIVENQTVMNIVAVECLQQAQE